MELALLSFDNDTHESIDSLRRHIELNEGRRTRPIKTIEDLIALIKHSEKSLSRRVTNALAKFVFNLNQSQISFFKTLGIDLLEDTRHKDIHETQYRGAYITARKNTNNNLEEQTMNKQHLAKRKMIYRGQTQ